MVVDVVKGHSAVILRARIQLPSDMASHSRGLESSGRCCVPADCIMSVRCCEELRDTNYVYHVCELFY